MDKLNWAVLGTGVVANQMAQAMQGMGCKLYAVGNRTHSKAVDFADKYGIEKVYDDLNDMFYDDNVDVIYITSPHNTHIDFIMKALENGKHILCEKSITLNSVELEKALKKADGKNLVLAEAMTIYHMPLYKKLSNSFVYIPTLHGFCRLYQHCTGKRAAFWNYIRREL